MIFLRLAQDGTLKLTLKLKNVVYYFEVSKCNKMVMSVGSGESCRPTARANGEGMLVLSTDRAAKTNSESRSLLYGIFDFQFVLGLCVLKIIIFIKYKRPEYLP